MHLIALGANLPSASGDPRATLEAALAALAARGLVVAARSRWYRTPAYPPGAGPDYVNGAAALAATLPPAVVLGMLHAVENDLGRLRGRRWGPRVCDLDLLASGAAVLPDPATVRDWIERVGAARMASPPGLILPHPRLQERGFVLRPLADDRAGLAAPAARPDGGRDAGGAAGGGAGRGGAPLAEPPRVAHGGEREGAAMRAMVLTAGSNRSRRSSGRCPSRGRRRCWCGSPPAASAAPTCTSSTASCPTSQLPRSCPATRSSAGSTALGAGVARLRARRARRRPLARAHLRRLPLLPRGPREPLRRRRLHRLHAATAATPSTRSPTRATAFPLPDALRRRRGGAAALRRADRLPLPAHGRRRRARSASTASAPRPTSWPRSRGARAGEVYAFTRPGDGDGAGLRRASSGPRWAGGSDEAAARAARRRDPLRAGRRRWCPRRSRPRARAAPWSAAAST